MTTEMNERERTKREKEERCLQHALSAIHKLDNESAAILMMLGGDEVQRDRKEEPDFIKRHIDKNEKTTLCGAEHFRVDRLAFRNNKDKVESLGSVIDNEAFQMGKQYDKLSPLQRIKRVVTTTDVLRLALKGVSSQYSTTYKSLIESFEHSLDHHLDRVQTYKDNLLSLAQNDETTKVVFLIDMHIGSNLLTVHKSGRKSLSKPFLFSDIVNALEARSGRLSIVDYIVMCIYGPDDGMPRQVIALESQDIRRQLRKRNIAVCNYIGDDCFNFEGRNQITPRDLINANTLEDGKALMADAIRAITGEHKKHISCAVRRCLCCEHRNIPYVTNLPVELALMSYKLGKMESCLKGINERPASK